MMAVPQRRAPSAWRCARCTPSGSSCSTACRPSRSRRGSRRSSINGASPPTPPSDSSRGGAIAHAGRYAMLCYAMLRRPSPPQRSPPHRAVAHLLATEPRVYAEWCGRQAVASAQPRGVQRDGRAGALLHDRCATQNIPRVPCRAILTLVVWLAGDNPTSDIEGARRANAFHAGWPPPPSPPPPPRGADELSAADDWPHLSAHARGSSQVAHVMDGRAGAHGRVQGGRRHQRRGGGGGRHRPGGRVGAREGEGSRRWRAARKESKVVACSRRATRPRGRSAQQRN